MAHTQQAAMFTRMAIAAMMALAGCAPAPTLDASPGASEQVTALMTAPPIIPSPPRGSSPASTPMPPARSSAPRASPSAAATPTTAAFPYAFPLQPAEVCDYARGVEAHGYPAIDIFAPPGTDFVAVTSGVVNFVSPEDLWDPAIDDPAARGGLAVAIIGDDGVRYYGSHLSEVASGVVPGARVERGQLLGKVGSTGNARGRDAHLHFGISQPTYPEDWQRRRGEVDPFPYLEAWEIGIDIRPALP